MKQAKKCISSRIRMNRKDRMICLPLLNPEDSGRVAGHEFGFVLSPFVFLTLVIVYRILHGDEWRKNEYILNSSRKNCIKNMNSADIKIPQPHKNSCGIFIKWKEWKKWKRDKLYQFTFRCHIEGRELFVCHFWIAYIPAGQLAWS